MRNLARRLGLLLGWYDLRAECIRHVLETMGPDCAAEFGGLYDNVNRGIPMDLMTTVAVIDVVETVKRKLESQCIWHRLKKQDGVY